MHRPDRIFIAIKEVLPKSFFVIQILWTEFHGQRSLAGSIGSQRVWHNWSDLARIHAPKKYIWSVYKDSLRLISKWGNANWHHEISFYNYLTTAEKVAHQDFIPCWWVCKFLLFYKSNLAFSCKIKYLHSLQHSNYLRYILERMLKISWQHYS